jgi:stage II sporulation protein D
MLENLADRRPWTGLAAVVVAAATLAACAPARPVSFPATPAVAVPTDLRVRTEGRMRTVPIEEYVLGAILSEVTPVGEAPDVVGRIYELQSIVARTYAVAHLGRHRAEGFDMCETTHCQIYQPARIASSRFTATARAAVARTTGRILTYGARPAEAFFHADCGGSTAAAEDVWGGRAVPYLRAVVDELPAATHRPWRADLAVDEVRRALNADERTAVGRRLDAIEVLARDDSGRAAGLGVRGERSYTVRGDVLRAVLNRTFGARAVQSTRFDLARQGTRYILTGTGFGHGVGLCQRGAIARLRRGESVGGVLDTYFPGSRVGVAGS